MPRLSPWNSGLKGANYRYQDRQLSLWIGVSGTAVFVHKYLGPHDQTPGGSATPPTETTIQDVLLLENRDRRYSQEVFELRGVYNVNDIDQDMRQFGIFLQSDTIFLELHINDTIALLGRKIMIGDVIELPHLRDDAPLDPATPAMNKFYVVEDVTRASDGYAPTWFPHLFRVKAVPMTGAQEYQDILDKQMTDPFGLENGTGTIGDMMTTIGVEMGVNEAVVEQAKLSVKARNFETRQFWVVPGDEITGQNPWVFAGDGVPPDGAALVGSGNRFPDTPAEGDYYLRTDYSPHTLFRRVSGRWRIQEVDYRRGDWKVAHRLLEDFINNRKVDTYKDGTTAPERQMLSQAAKPTADF